MFQARTYVFLLSALIVIPFVSTANNCARADEPAADFLEALRDRGYYDIAIDYLTSLESSDLISPEYRTILPFEKAETLIKSVSRVRDTNVLEARLNEAEKLLAKFSGSVDSPQTAARTQRYRGNLRLGRSRLYSRQSESKRLTEQEKNALISKSREMLNLALQDYTEARSSLRTAIENFQIDVSDVGTTKELKRLRSTYTQIRLRLPIVKEQLADSHKTGSPEQMKLLSEAAEEYIYLYDNYRRFAAGLDSGLYSARCYKKMGKYSEALLRLKELFVLENNGTFKNIKKKALLLGTECWAATKPYPANEVIKECSPMVDVLSRQDQRSPDWLRIKLELAKAYNAKATSMETEKEPGTSGKIREYKRLAGKIVREVSRAPGSTRETAKALAAEWNLDVRARDDEEKAPETFIDARQKGEDYITELQSLAEIQGRLQSNLRLASSDIQKNKFSGELAENKELIELQTETALKMFELALSLSDEKTALADINKVRYLQCYCYFLTSRHFEAALIGEFLLSRYPTIDWTRQAASVAVRSYTSMYNSAPKDNRVDEQEKLIKTCQDIVKRWPGSSECSAAASTLTAIAIENKDFTAAEKSYANIGEDYPSRAKLGLKLGQRIWFAYSKPPQKLSEEKKKELLTKSLNFLEQGLNNTAAENINYDAALSSLLLVNAYLADGQIEKAANRLENENISPLTLLKQNHPAVTQSSKSEAFQRGAYNTAIDTYLAAVKLGSNQEQWMNKAAGVISAMRNSDISPASLTNTYRRIATILTAQFDSLATPDEKRKFSKVLSTFLGSIEKDSNDSTTVLSAGSTLLSVANSLKAQKMDADAAPIFKQAVSALTRAEELGFKGKDREQRIMELQRQKALANRGTGNFDAALNQLAEILKTSPNNLDVQIDAAQTLHLIAEKAQTANAFAEASGGKIKVKDKKTKRESNAVWGWRKLFQVTKNKDKYLEANMKALYHQVDAMYNYGKLKPNPKAVNAAKQQLAKFAKTDPSLGGPKWKAKFEALQKKMK